MNKPVGTFKRYEYNYIGKEDICNGDGWRLLFYKTAIRELNGSEFPDFTHLEKVDVFSPMQYAKEMVARGYAVEMEIPRV